MRKRQSAGAEPVTLRATIPTPEGKLDIAASRIDGRWWVVARCRRWRGFGMARTLGPAVDAALGPYRNGVAVNGDLR